MTRLLNIWISLMLIAVIAAIVVSYNAALTYKQRKAVIELPTPKVNQVRVWTREQLLERCTGKGLRYEECGAGEWYWCSEDKKTACQRIGPR